MNWKDTYLRILRCFLYSLPCAENSPGPNTTLLRLSNQGHRQLMHRQEHIHKPNPLRNVVRDLPDVRVADDDVMQSPRISDEQMIVLVDVGSVTA